MLQLRKTTKNIPDLLMTPYCYYPNVSPEVAYYF